MLYNSLNDAAKYKDLESLEKGDTEIWYQKQSTLMGEKYLPLRSGLRLLKAKYNELIPTKETLSETHVLIGKIKETDLEKIFTSLQGEIYAPLGEAAALISKYSTGHTSMMVGDIVIIDGIMYYCDMIGWGEI